jgi:hypothetical protein
LVILKSIHIEDNEVLDNLEEIKKLLKKLKFFWSWRNRTNFKNIGLSDQIFYDSECKIK